jgi:uncharacterized damage-inducible protein DinB
MHPMEVVAGALDWVGPDLAYNLDFIPEDKLEWKPEPTAKSAMAVAIEVERVIRNIVHVIETGAWEELAPVTQVSKPEIQEALRNACKEYGAAVRAIPPERLSDPIETPWGTTPLAHFATYALIEASHHRGQIFYLQTLLGDTEQHTLQW